MSPTAAAKSTVTETTATETMLDAKSTTMESAAVVAARMVRTAIAVVAAGMVITGIAIRIAVVTITNAASQNADGDHRQKRVERPSPLAELRR